MSAESEPKADEALQTRPASAFSRVWSRSLPVLLNWFRTAPCSIILTLIIMLVGIAAHLSHGHWNQSLAAQGGAIHPLAIVTTVVWSPSIGMMINAALMMVIIGGLLERFLGSRIWLLSAVISLPMSLAGMWAFVALIRGISRSGLYPLFSGPLTGASLILTALLGTASAKMDRLWAWRTRIGALVVLSALLAFSSTAGALARLIAFLCGWIIGGFTIGWSNRGRSMLGIGDPVRRVIPLVITAATLGAVSSIWNFSAHGFLAFDRAAFSPELAIQQYMWALCQQSAAPMSCVKEMYGNSLMLYAPLILASIPFVVQLVLAFGLFRGRRGAWVGTLVLQSVLAIIGVAQIMVFALSVNEAQGLDGDDFFIPSIPMSKLLISVAFPLVTLLLTAWNSSAFQVRIARRYWVRSACVIAVCAAFGTLIALVIGVLIPDQFVPEADLLSLFEAYVVSYAPAGAQWLIDTPVYATTFLASISTVWIPVLVWIVVAVCLLKVFLAPVELRHDAHDELIGLLRQHGAGSLGWMLAWPGNSTWISPDQRAAVSYRQESGVALTLTQCAATDDDIPAVISQFSRFASDAALTPALYSVHEEWAREAHRLGWSTVKVAEEAIIDLGDLAFKGKKFQDVRTAFNHAKREGIRAEWASYPSLPAGLKQQVDAICQAWADEKVLPEMGFTLGGLREINDSDTRLLLALDEEERIHAVTSWMPVHSGGEVVGLTLDVMRRDDSGFRLAIDFLIGQAALLAQDEGLQFISLSGAPLAESGQCEESSELADSRFAFAPVLDVMGSVMEPVYGFRSLLAYKKKFQVRFVPLYLAIPDIANAPAVGLAIAHAYLPNMSAISAVGVAAKLVSRD